MNDVKKNIAKNLYNLRQKNKLTQADLAKKLNYTDKSISKWEKGDATPPIEILCEIANLYGVTVDFLTKENNDMEIYDRYSPTVNRPNKLVITLLAVSLVWLIATVLFVYGFNLGNMVLWKLFVYAIPVSALVLLVFNSIWGKKKYSFIIVSVTIWTILLSIFITFLEYTPWATFLIGIPIQIAIILWSKMIIKG